MALPLSLGAAGIYPAPLLAALQVGGRLRAQLLAEKLVSLSLSSFLLGFYAATSRRRRRLVAA